VKELIVFSDILKMLSDHGWSTYRLQKEKRISNGVIIQIRAKKPLSTTTIDKICELCDCQPGDLMRYVPSKQEE
jgi:DNA-binding Xre family transcriptional regulator